MENRIMSSPAKLLPQVAKAIPGVTTYAGVLGLAAGKAAAMEAEELALQLAQNLYRDKVKALKAAQVTKRAALKAAQTTMFLIRETAKPTLGKKFSHDWAAFGFNNNLQIPRGVDNMVGILGTTGGHLITHPQFGSADLNTEAAQVEVVKTNLENANTAVGVRRSEARALHNDRKVKAAAVRQSLREVLSACRLKFDPLDGRWSEFGFNRPGVLSVPEVPAGVTVSLIGTNALAVKWPAVERAEHYRLWLRVVGQDAELNSMGTTAQLEHVFQNLPANSQVEVAISAASESGESGKSAVVTMLTQ